MRSWIVHKRMLGVAALCALAVTGCGSGHHAAAPGGRTAGKLPKHDTLTVHIYSSLPLRGPQHFASTEIQRGIWLALKQRDGHVGSIAVKYLHRSDSSRHRPGWNPQQTVKVAEEAAADPQAVAYIGDLDSGATELSLPILNQAGIVQLTPGSGYPGLTDSVTVGKTEITAAGEPAKYYPQHKRTLLRLIPNDLVQAAAALELLQKSDCHAVGVWQFGGGAEATALLRTVQETAGYYSGFYHLSVPALPPLPRAVKDYPTYAAGLAQKVGCAVLTGRATPAAVAFTSQLHHYLPVAKIVATSGLCNPGWTRSLPSYMDPSLYCMTPMRPLRPRYYRRSAAFIAAFRARFHRRPSTYAYYGYQAAEMILNVVYQLGSGLDNRSQLAQALLDGDGSAPLGSFDPSGNLSPWIYGVERVVNRAPEFYEALSPTSVLPSDA